MSNNEKPTQPDNETTSGYMGLPEDFPDSKFHETVSMLLREKTKSGETICSHTIHPDKKVRVDTTVNIPQDTIDFNAKEMRASSINALSKEPLQEIIHYKKMKVIGKGGMGKIYEALDSKTGKMVAIKELEIDTRRQKLTRNEIEDKEHFIRESLIVRGIDHPHIVGGQNLFTASDSGYMYFVMDYINGQNLEVLKKKENLTIIKTLVYFIQIAKALAYAHEQGLIHRDIKPANIMITTVENQPHAMLVDFGIAAKSFMEDVTIDTNFLHQTAEGHFLGTFLYMSPEQYLSRFYPSKHSVDHRSDQFSFAITMFDVLTGGDYPFQVDNKSNNVVKDAIVEGRFQHLTIKNLKVSMPQETRDVLNAFLQTMSQKEPDHRFTNMKIAAQMLINFLRSYFERQEKV